jgi:hypothetical protein
LVEPVQRGTFGDARCAVEESSSVVGEKNVASFAVDTLVGLTTSLVLGTLACKGKINRDALPGDRGRAGGIVSRGTLGKLGGEADRTLLKDGFTVREFWNAVDVCMGMVKVVVTGMG